MECNSHCGQASSGKEGQRKGCLCGSHSVTAVCVDVIRGGVRARADARVTGDRIDSEACMVAPRETPPVGGVSHRAPVSLSAGRQCASKEK